MRSVKDARKVTDFQVDYELVMRACLEAVAAFPRSTPSVHTCKLSWPHRSLFGQTVKVIYLSTTGLIS